MGKRGPKPLPKAVTDLRGTTKAGRGARRPPAFKPGAPKAPKSLSPLARAKWDEVIEQLVASGCVDEVNREALARRCEAHAAAEDIARAIKADIGGDWMDSDSQRRVRLYRDMSVLAKQWDAEFGLTPSSKTRVDLPKQKPEEPQDPLELAAMAAAAEFRELAAN